MLAFSLICALGCLVRYCSELLANRVFKAQRLWGTMAVNILGCGIVGLVTPSSMAQYFLAFCGGLTSFSAAFAGPVQVWRSGLRHSAAISLLATPLLCAGAYFLAVNA